MTGETCKDGNRAKFGKNSVMYDPQRLYKGKVKPSLIQFEDLENLTAPGRPISFGKRFIVNVDEVFKEIKKGQ